MNSIGLAVGGRYDNSLGMISRLTVLILTSWNVMFLTAADLRTGFEQAPIGEIREIKTAVGTWTAAAGHAEVTAGYHYMGKQCLHLFGGKARTIEFKPAESVKMPGHLVFQAERWTSRNPFQFRIEERVNGKWGELFNGDHAVVVGDNGRVLRTSDGGNVWEKLQGFLPVLDKHSHGSSRCISCAF